MIHKHPRQMSTIPRYARYADETVRQFKQRKRREIRIVLQAFDRFRLGCAYAPGFSCVGEIQQLLEQIKLACAVKKWK